jgi:hypothetical protein
MRLFCANGFETPIDIILRITKIGTPSAHGRIIGRACIPAAVENVLHRLRVVVLEGLDCIRDLRMELMADIAEKPAEKIPRFSSSLVESMARLAVSIAHRPSAIRTSRRTMPDYLIAASLVVESGVKQ